MKRLGCRCGLVPLVLLMATFMATMATSGCNSLDTVSRKSLLAALRQAKEPVSGPIVAEGADGLSVRIDPRSRIRFELADGTVTPWIEARRLRTSTTGISVGKELLAGWDEVRLAEVENLSGPRVLAGVVALAAVVVLVAALLKGSGKVGGGGGGGGKKLKVGGVRHVGRVGGARHVGRVGGAVRASRGGRIGRGGRGARAGVSRHHGGGRVSAWRRRHRWWGGSRIVIVEPRLSAAISVEAEAPPPPPFALPSPGSAERALMEGEEPTSVADPSSVDPPRAPSRPLFSSRARRDALYRFFVAGTVGGDLREPMGLADSVTLGVRLSELVELGAGFRHMLVAHEDAKGAIIHDSSAAAFLRAGLHIDMTSGRRVSVPVTIDAGIGSPFRYQLRINWGLRVRIVGGLWLGAYPFSPTYTVYRDRGRLANAPRWSFPTSLEVGLTF